MEAGVAQPVYTPYAAQLDKVLVQEGQQVKAGQKLFELVAVPRTSRIRRWR
jgi:putative peptide zinc metalloprotease protein